jgi:shikimate kinase
MAVDPEIRHMACVGLMAAGKTTVAELVAESLGWRHVDVDAEVEARTGRTVAELAYEGGEGAYRPWEWQVLLQALDAEERSVVAAPGGVALDPEARKAIGAIHVVAVYLRADPDRLAARVGEEEAHHLGGADPDRLAVLQGMFRDRDATYRALADIEVSVDGLHPRDAAALVVAALPSGPSIGLRTVG